MSSGNLGRRDGFIPHAPVDENGLSYGIKHIQNKLRVSAMPYTYDIAEGNITGHSPWSKIGIHLAIGSTELDMRPYAAVTAGIGWTYTFPTTELTMTIVSDSAEDDADKTPDAGTGAYTITVYYLNSEFEEKTKVCTMNGTSAVTIGTDVYRVQNARVSTTGTACCAVGNITIASGGQTYGFITAGKTRMRQCIWTVPKGKTLYVTQITFSCSDQASGKYVRFMTKANFDEKSGTILQRGLFLPYNEVTLNNSAYVRELNPPTKLPATTDLKVSAISNSAAAGTCSLRGWVENN